MAAGIDADRYLDGVGKEKYLLDLTFHAESFKHMYVYGTLFSIFSINFQRQPSSETHSLAKKQLLLHDDEEGRSNR